MIFGLGLYKDLKYVHASLVTHRANTRICCVCLVNLPGQETPNKNNAYRASVHEVNIFLSMIASATMIKTVPICF